MTPEQSERALFELKSNLFFISYPKHFSLLLQNRTWFLKNRVVEV